MAKKCVICGKPIDKEEETNCVPYKNRLAHPDCFNFAMKTIKDNKDEQLEKQKKKKETQSKISGRGRKASVKTPKAELKDTVSDEEYREKKAFYDLLKNIIGTDKLTPKIYAVSEMYITKYNMTWDGMKNTLIYLRDIKEKELLGDIVGIIPHYYSESENFYKEVQEVEEHNKDINVNKLYSERVIQITPPKRIIKQLSFDD